MESMLKFFQGFYGVAESRKGWFLDCLGACKINYLVNLNESDLMRVFIVDSNV